MFVYLFRSQNEEPAAEVFAETVCLPLQDFT